MSLIQNVPDFFVHVDQKVDVRRGRVCPFVFDQELFEPRLQGVSLSDHSKLERKEQRPYISEFQVVLMEYNGKNSGYLLHCKHPYLSSELVLPAESN